MKKLINVFLQLVYREILLFIKVIKSKLIDIIIITFANIMVFFYLMPYFGLERSYAPLIAVGLLPIISFFEAIPRATTLIADITGNKKISYFLTLPLPTNLILISIPVGWAVCGGIYTILILPIAKLILLSKLDLSNFSVLKFIISFISVQLMFGFFAFFLSSLIKDMKYISWIWSRIVNPLFMFGGYFYTWKAVYSVSSTIGTLNLFNPVMLSCETLRASVLGQIGFLNFWIAVLGLWAFIFIFAFFSVIRLKKRLDCV